MIFASLCQFLLITSGADSEVTFDWVTVGHPDNFADAADGDAFSAGDQHFGAVDHSFRIAAHEVTNAQFTEFLNAVDPDGSNTHSLYHPSMGLTLRGGIALVPGNASGAKYTVKPNMGNKPVNFVEWADAARFANWMHNGQKGAGTTESGAYDMTTATPSRLAGATIFLPSEDEWYKAAYFDPVNSAADSGGNENYWAYGTMNDTTPQNAQASATGDITNPGPNVANYGCSAEWNGDGCNLTTVGSGSSVSFYGAFDMAGNVWEWNESSQSRSRGVRGGAARFTPNFLDSSARGIPAFGDYDDMIGFRIARSASNVSGFTETTVAGLPDFDGSPAWGDYDNDGLLDFLIIGKTPADLPAGTATSQLWRNTGNGFLHIPTPGLPGVQGDPIAWGDYDNDGWLDFLISGLVSPTSTRTPILQLWRNLGGTGFALVPIQGLAGISGSADWGDYDNDGRLDFIVAGFTGVDLGGQDQYSAQLWRNTGAGFVNVAVPGLQGAGSGSLDWIDFDKDGWLDFSLTGTTIGRGSAGGLSELWRNTGTGFAKVSIEGLTGVVDGSMSWCDYDIDGRLDFLLTGVGWIKIVDRPDPLPDVWDYANLAQLWRNTPEGFQWIPTPGLPGCSGTVAWGDYDNDGRSDLLVSGSINDLAQPSQLISDRNATSIWRNTGAGFAEVPAGIEDFAGSAVWGDYDQDGRLDILFSGNNFPLGTPLAGNTVLLRGTTTNRNTPPSAPSGLNAVATTQGVTLSWLPAADDQTPAVSLSYNLVLSSTPNGMDLSSPMANLVTGFRRVVELGGSNLRTSWSFTNLPPSPAYYWSVQAVDTSFAGGRFATSRSEWLPVPVTSVARTGSDQARFTFNGLSGQTYNVEKSEDLSIWTAAGIATESPAGSGLFTFVDPTAIANATYYRFVQIEALPGFTYVPAGPFIMGNTAIDPDIIDATPVTATIAAFHIGQTEVTRAQWNEVASWAANQGYVGLPVRTGASLLPVDGVSWFSALIWCNARSEKEGKIPAYYTDAAHTAVYKGTEPGVLIGTVPVFANWNASGYRLPTEAEWEKAARGGLTGQRFPWGSTISHSQANYNSVDSPFDTSPTRGFLPEFAGRQPGDLLTEAGRFQPNPLAIHDVAGNLAEWCWDFYQSSLAGGSNPRGPSSGTRRVFRGGSWASPTPDCRVAARHSLEPWTNLPSWATNTPFFGLRIVLPASR